MYADEDLPARQRISLRTGCFCNPGDGEVAHHISLGDGGLLHRVPGAGDVRRVPRPDPRRDRQDAKHDARLARPGVGLRRCVPLHDLRGRVPMSVASTHEKALASTSTRALRHVRRNRRRPGGRPLVLPRRRRRRHGGQDHLRLRHGGQRRHLRPAPTATSAASACTPCSTTSTLCSWNGSTNARRPDRVLRVRQHRRHAQRRAGNEATAGWASGSRRARAARRRSSSTSACSTKENVRQQEALGVIGVNLIHGAFFASRADPRSIDRRRCSTTWRGTRRGGHDPVRRPGFAGVDNRLMSLCNSSSRVSPTPPCSPPTATC